MAENFGEKNGFHSDEEDEERSQRPVNIEADVREMERRKRVENIMNSKIFREELERVVGDKMRDSDGEFGLSALIKDAMKPSIGGGLAATTITSSSAVIPINDIRGLDSMIYAKGEKQLRCKLAAVYRLIHLQGWAQGISNHVTARISQDTEHFLLNPYGLHYSEMTASSLVKVNMQGELVEEGTTNFGVHQDNFALHSAIHAARPDVKCIIHLRTQNVVAVSAMKCGLIPVCQEACLIGDCSYHTYKPAMNSSQEAKDELAKDLGPSNKVMFLRNYGVVCCGRTVEEAWYMAYHTILAVDTQLKMLPYGLDNLVPIEEAVRANVYELAQGGGGGVNHGTKKEWGVGELEFEALMRKLDNMGYRTGYQYAEPLVKKDPPKQVSDVEVPPTVSNLSYLLEDDELCKDGGLRTLLTQLLRSNKKSSWVNNSHSMFEAGGDAKK
eukprot:TRINITY_DN20856_c0_g1_i1.p1 TRINITY_DN20856_c0_g1~~TRINITY_DN20856_c0_g1_i1.p1  ORF type:complete len:441 (+),score=157.10 TRINITY_DN20856_c0_g1_i1:181-1503(+)